MFAEVVERKEKKTERQTLENAAFVVASVAPDNVTAAAVHIRFQMKLNRIYIF